MNGPGDPKQSPSAGLPGWLLAALYAVAVIGPTVASIADGGPTIGKAVVVAAGVAALAMLLAQFVTSGRFERVSGRLGLDVTMGFHRMAGMAVLALVAVHVFAIPLQHGLPSLPRYATRLANSLAAPGNAPGLAATLFLLVLVPWAKWFRGRIMRYEIWRLVHGLGATLIVVLVALHAAHRGESLFTPAALTMILLLAAVGIGSLVVVYAVRPRTAYGHGFRIEGVRRLSPTVVELTALSEQARFAFRPGQFAWIAFAGRHTLTDNPFSIASAPEDLPRLRFLIREAGDGTRRVATLKPGVAVAVDGPHGSFVEHGNPEALVLIAGGIGIAPILSILRSAAARGDRRPYRLVYATRRAEDLIARAEILDLTQRLDLRVDTLVEDGELPAGSRRGRMTADAMKAFVSDLDCTRVLAFVCGPPGLMDAAAAMLVECGFGSDRIVMERFDYDAAHDPVSRIVRRRFMMLFAGMVALLAGALAIFA
ncbi:ferredoxin reductase family protein [Chthonobacter albigriseus]|uniref:ferredoxin reductase family protein n=1 Tax=Chthonobacter albigriseus TaxID=1683161 RepID=UPI0015EE5514|nr:ferredoxin reductase family protein [Chthonobacter albigriseus]